MAMDRAAAVGRAVRPSFGRRSTLSRSAGIGPGSFHSAAWRPSACC